MELASERKGESEKSRLLVRGFETNKSIIKTVTLLERSSSTKETNEQKQRCEVIKEKLANYPHSSLAKCISRVTVVLHFGTQFFYDDRTYRVV